MEPQIGPARAAYSCSIRDSKYEGGTLTAAYWGMNANTAFGPVGNGVGPMEPPGMTHTVFDLLAPDLHAGAIDCAGPGTYELHSTHHPCPITVGQHREWSVCTGGTGEPPYPQYSTPWEWDTLGQYPCSNSSF